MGNPAGNTMECFNEFVGQKLVGFVADARGVGFSVGTKLLVFEDGRALALYSNGAWWVATAEEVRSSLRITREELERATAALRGVLALAGEPHDDAEIGA